jgi:hypothetical protein
MAGHLCDISRYAASNCDKCKIETSHKFAPIDALIWESMMFGERGRVLQLRASRVVHLTKAFSSPADQICFDSDAIDRGTRPESQ